MDVTKYECQKGQFKGFFVSSPKFCVTSPSLNLMTWNIYLGADLSPIFVATTPQEFVAAVGSAYKKIQASNFVERANSIANVLSIRCLAIHIHIPVSYSYLLIGILL